MNKERSLGQSILDGLQYVSSNWVLIVFLLGITGSLIGKVKYDISFFQPLEEIAARQADYHHRQKQLEKLQQIVDRHIKLGNEFLDVMQLKAARHEFEKALELDPNNPAAHFGRLKAEVFDPILAGDYDPEVVKKRLNAILEERRKDPHALAMLGFVYRVISPQESKQYFNRAIAADPDMASAYAGLALVVEMERTAENREQNLAEVIAILEQARMRSEWNQNYLNNLGYQYLQQQDYARAIENYRLLLSLDGRYLLTYYTLANAYRLQGDDYRADWYHTQLLRLLDDAEITALTRNTEAWFFHTRRQTIHFYTESMKQTYAFYSAALSRYLYRGEGEADGLLEQAEAVGSDDRVLILGLLQHDIALLRAARPDLASRLDAFEAKL